MNKNKMNTTETTNTTNRRKPFLPGNREILIESLVKNWAAVAKDAGTVLLTARQVLDVLQKLELLPSLSGKQLVGANAVGDVLGSKHYNLPFVIAGTKRKYLIPAIAWTAQQKDEFEALPFADKLARLKSLDGEMLGEPPAVNQTPDDQEVSEKNTMEVAASLVDGE